MSFEAHFHDVCVCVCTDAMSDRMASFTEKYEFEDEFTESLHMSDMMQFVLASKVRPLHALLLRCALQLQAPVCQVLVSECPCY